MSMDAKTLGEEIIGAEIVAGKELAEAAGSVFEAMEQGSAIWQQQSRWLVEDYGVFLRSSLTRPGHPAGLVDLVQSRSEHISTGMQQTGALIQREFVPVTRIWTNFFGTVMRDWRSG